MSHASCAPQSPVVRRGAHSLIRLTAVAALALSLTACWSGSTGTTGQQGASGPAFAYVAKQGDGTVSAYSIDASTGALTQLTGSPFAAGTYPVFVTVNPAGTFAYAANQYGNTVSAYSIDATTGALTPVAGSPFATGDSPVSVTVNPAGTFAYVANFGSGNNAPGTVSAYSINASTGALKPVAGSPFAAGNHPASVAVAQP